MIVMVMSWPEITQHQYEEVRRLVKWETDQPKGARNHVSWFEGGGLHVVDVWESEADLDHFIQQRLMPVVKGQLGVKSDPQVTIHPVHLHFVPERVKQERATAKI